MSAPRSLPPFKSERTPTAVYPSGGTAPDAPGLSTAHICTVTSYRGGSYSELRPPPGRGRPGGGGPRGQITDFSKASRRRLLRLVNQIDKGRTAKPLFLTLTYPAAWPKDPRVWKNHLKAFRERMRRKYGKFPAIWRLEFQKRGAPHFHLLIFAEMDLNRLYLFLSRAWYEVVGSGDDKHLLAGTQAARVKSWRGVKSYAAKYMGKLEQLQEGVQLTGRFWGTWYRDLLPIEAETNRITVSEFFKLRRVLRRASRIRSQSLMGTFGCYLEHANANRLLAWLGIIGSELGDEENEHRRPPTRTTTRIEVRRDDGMRTRRRSEVAQERRPTRS